MRGKEKREVDENQPCGITPAHAGKRTGSLTAPQQIGDHPRTCGEKVLFCAGALLCQGSPPHMRGKGVPVRAVFTCWGITPAHAGKRGAGQGSLYMLGDHPRTCGEKYEKQNHWCLPEGSPPHMRGKAPRSAVRTPAIGITPAHAGKSCPFLRRTSPRRDHPRTCGEKWQLLHGCGLWQGSPPHMRGKGI